MKKPENKDCSECQYISITEELQNHQIVKSPHLCTLLDVRIYHVDRHPILKPLPACPINKAHYEWEAYHDGFIAVLDHAVSHLPSEEEIRNILGRCYTTKENEFKEMDVILMTTIAKAIYNRITNA